MTAFDMPDNVSRLIRRFLGAADGGLARVGGNGKTSNCLQPSPGKSGPWYLPKSEEDYQVAALDEFCQSTSLNVPLDILKLVTQFSSTRTEWLEVRGHNTRWNPNEPSLMSFRNGPLRRTPCGELSHLDAPDVLGRYVFHTGLRYEILIECKKRGTYLRVTTARAKYTAYCGIPSTERDYSLNAIITSRSFVKVRIDLSPQTMDANSGQGILSIFDSAEASWRSSGRLVEAPARLCVRPLAPAVEFRQTPLVSEKPPSVRLLSVRILAKGDKWQAPNPSSNTKLSYS